jgi:cell division septal protein FtsQ
MAQRRKRLNRRRAAVVIAAAAVIGLAWVGVPRVIARLPLFRVRRVELIGLKYLAPDPILAAMRLGPESSVFTDVTLLADRIKGVSGVADAAVERRYPGTLEIFVREVEPAAFVAGENGKLVLVDGSGRVLPFDPERAALDLPVASRDSSVLSVLALVHSVEPGLFETITTARGVPRRGGGVLLDLGSRRILFGSDARPAEVRSVALVERDLALKGRPYTELDARFAGQVVVRHRGKNRGGTGA